MPHPDTYGLDGTALATLEILNRRGYGARTAYCDIVVELRVCGVPHRLSSFGELERRYLITSTSTNFDRATAYELTVKGRAAAASL